MSTKTLAERLNNLSLICNQAYINGSWCDANDGGELEVVDPADQKVIGKVPNMGAAETTKAIEAAHEAFASWRKKTAKERSKILKSWNALILENKEDLAAIMTAEQGKPTAEATNEIIYAASFIEWFAEEAKRVDGKILPTVSGDRRLLVLKEPVGVCAAITPWNFPSAMITRKTAPALAAGCTVVVKPASETPLSALALAVLAEKAGIPPGVFNVVVGRANEIGKELTTNPLVRKFSFTGSTAIGKKLLEQCASTVKRTSLELGGNAPLIVFNDADLNLAVSGALASRFRNSGQTCVCANRILVQEDIAEEFAKRLADEAEKLVVGSGFDEHTTQGPLINQDAIDKMERLVSDAADKGAKIVTGGSRHDKGGLFFQPTVMTNLSQKMSFYEEEIFGPIAAIFTFKTEEEALKIANDTSFGLASYFYTQDISRIWRMSEGLEYGMVGANESLISNEISPFGGVKESGMGREGSSFGIEEYVQLKYSCIGNIQSEE